MRPCQAFKSRPKAARLVMLSIEMPAIRQPLTSGEAYTTGIIRDVARSEIFNRSRELVDAVLRKRLTAMKEEGIVPTPPPRAPQTELRQASSFTTKDLCHRPVEPPMRNSVLDSALKSEDSMSPSLYQYAADLDHFSLVEDLPQTKTDDQKIAEAINEETINEKTVKEKEEDVVDPTTSTDVPDTDDEEPVETSIKDLFEQDEDELCERLSKAESARNLSSSQQDLNRQDLKSTKSDGSSVFVVEHNLTQEPTEMTTPIVIIDDAEDNSSYHRLSDAVEGGSRYQVSEFDDDSLPYHSPHTRVLQIKRHMAQQFGKFGRNLMELAHKMILPRQMYRRSSISASLFLPIPNLYETKIVDWRKSAWDSRDDYWHSIGKDMISAASVHRDTSSSSDFYRLLASTCSMLPKKVYAFSPKYRGVLNRAETHARYIQFAELLKHLLLGGLDDNDRRIPDELSRLDDILRKPKIDHYHLILDLEIITRTRLSEDARKLTPSLFNRYNFDFRQKARDFLGRFYERSLPIAPHAAGFLAHHFPLYSHYDLEYDLLHELIDIDSPRPFKLALSLHQKLTAPDRVMTIEETNTFKEGLERENESREEVDEADRDCVSVALPPGGGGSPPPPSGSSTTIDGKVPVNEILRNWQFRDREAQKNYDYMIWPLYLRNWYIIFSRGLSDFQIENERTFYEFQQRIHVALNPKLSPRQFIKHFMIAYDLLAPLKHQSPLMTRFWIHFGILRTAILAAGPDLYTIDWKSIKSALTRTARASEETPDICRQLPQQSDQACETRSYHDVWYTQNSGGPYESSTDPDASTLFGHPYYETALC